MAGNLSLTDLENLIEQGESPGEGAAPRNSPRFKLADAESFRSLLVGLDAGDRGTARRDCLRFARCLQTGFRLATSKGVQVHRPRHG